MAVEADDWKENRTEGGEEVKALFALVLSGLVLSGCDQGPEHQPVKQADNQEKAPKKETPTWEIKIEQNGIPDVVFTTGYANCVEAFRMGMRGDVPIYGYVIYKPDGGQIIVSGTTRITRTKVKNNNKL